MDPVLRPAHIANPNFELKFHRSCGHVTWHARAEPLVDLPSYKPPKFLHFGYPICHSCRMAQENLDPSTARLVASKVLGRITAIGFGRPRKDELKELRFSWSKPEEFWYFKPSDGTFEKDLLALAGLLSCKTEIIDFRVLPGLPGAIDELPPPHTPEWAFISCSPTGEKMTLTPLGEMAWADIGTTPWPPDLSALPTTSSAGLPPDVPRILGLPGVANLISHGFTREDLLPLMAKAADIGVALYFGDNSFDGRGLVRLASARASRGPTSTPQKSAKPKGGRPAKARAQSAEILRLASQKLSANKIAEHLKISPRSVRRVLDDAGHV